MTGEVMEVMGYEGDIKKKDQPLRAVEVKCTENKAQ